MPSRFADPAALSLVARMELVARQSVEGFLSGRHPSPYFGSSVEYADHRPYTQGDDLRTIDWKLLAKTDKHYVKLFAEQTNLRATIIVDASRSMGFGGVNVTGAQSANPQAAGTAHDSRLQLSAEQSSSPRAEPLTKLEYANFTAAALAYLLLRQNDAVGLAVFDKTILTHIPPRATANHFRVMLDALDLAAAGSDTAIGPVLHELAGRISAAGRRGLVILISDLLDDVDAIAGALSHFRHDRHEVIVFHVLDPAELEFPFEKLTRFKDMEGDASIIANPHSVRARDLARLDAYLTAVKRACHERGVGYVLARTDQPYAVMLSAYLEQRGLIATRLA